MTRRNFIKGVAAAGVASALPVGTLASLAQGCTPSGNASGWDFDEIVDRSGTWSIKYSRVKGDQIPMWIADMDFRTDPAVQAALCERMARDAFGYTRIPDEFFGPLRPGSRPGFCGGRRALLLIGACRSPRWPGVGRALQRHPFSGLVDSAGELLHTP